MWDILNHYGYKTSAKHGRYTFLFLLLAPLWDNNPMKEISSSHPHVPFNEKPATEYLDDLIYELNGETNDNETNSLYGETWSTRMYQAIAENQELLDLAAEEEFDQKKRVLPRKSIPCGSRIDRRTGTAQCRTGCLLYSRYRIRSSFCQFI